MRDLRWYQTNKKSLNVPYLLPVDLQVQGQGSILFLVRLSFLQSTLQIKTIIFILFYFILLQSFHIDQAGLELSNPHTSVSKISEYSFVPPNPAQDNKRYVQSDNLVNQCSFLTHNLLLIWWWWQRRRWQQQQQWQNSRSTASKDISPKELSMVRAQTYQGQ